MIIELNGHSGVGKLTIGRRVLTLDVTALDAADAAEQILAWARPGPAS